MAIVYKFGPIEAIDYLLSERTLRFAPPSVQNDLNECFPNLARMLADNMKRSAVDGYALRTTINTSWESLTNEEFYNAMFNTRDEFGCANVIGSLRIAWKMGHRKLGNFGLMSMSKARTNLLMWAHYASGGAGLCVGFDETARAIQDSEYVPASLRGMQDVRYSDCRATFEAATRQERLAQIALTKSDLWCGEAEVRCLRELGNDEDQVLVNFEPQDVREIIIGPNMLLEHVKRCIDCHRSTFPHAKLLVAIPDPEVFLMRFYECPRYAFLERVWGELPADIGPQKFE